MSANEAVQVTNEFIQQNAENAKIKKRSKSGGPYSKNDRAARGEEVFRLYIEYGYSAREIAKLMQVNRNTINRDVNYWYRTIILKNVDDIAAQKITLHLKRMEIQSTRLREQLDKDKSNAERIAIERLIYGINSKMIHIYQKLEASRRRTVKYATKWV